MASAQQEHPKVGDAAPEFRLAAAAGGEIALSDYRGNRSLLLWFSKGLFCPYCRRNMARLSQSYAQFQDCGAEILQISINTIEEARLYFRNYQLPMPYLCDAEREVHSLYGVHLERQGLAKVAENMLNSSALVVANLLLHGQKSPSPVAPVLRMGARFQPPQLIVLADREGVLRHVQSLGPFDTLPTVEELLTQLRALQQPT